MKRLLSENEILSHLLLTFIYFFTLCVLRFTIDINLLWIWLGAIVGTFILDLDHLIYWYILNPEVEDSVLARALIKNKDFRGTYRLLQKTHQSHTKLVFHTVLLQLVLLVLAIYLLSSGGSFFGSALIMAANLHLLKDVWQDYIFRGKTAVIEWFFWQIKVIDIEKYVDIYLILVSLLFVFLSYFLI